MFFWFLLVFFALFVLVAAVPKFDYELMRPVGVFTAFALIVWGAASIDYYGKNPEYDAQYCNQELVALSTGTELSGQVYLSLLGGSGSFSENQVISYLAQTNSGVKIDSKPARYSYIVESTEAPRMTCVNEKLTYDPWFISPWLKKYEYDSFSHYEFVVPPGAISTEFDIQP